MDKWKRCVRWDHVDLKVNLLRNSKHQAKNPDDETVPLRGQISHVSAPQNIQVQVVPSMTLNSTGKDLTWQTLQSQFSVVIRQQTAHNCIVPLPRLWWCIWKTHVFHELRRSREGPKRRHFPKRDHTRTLSTSSDIACTEFKHRLYYLGLPIWPTYSCSEDELIPYSTPVAPPRIVFLEYHSTYKSILI